MLTTGLQAGEINFQKIVEGISINGLQNVPASVLPTERERASQAGRRANATDLKNDINALYLTGYFSAVSAATVVSQNRLILEFTVQENPVINQIFIRGNAAFQESYLKTLLPVQENQVLNIKKVVEAKEFLTNFLIKQGYDLFKVVSIEMDQERNLTFIFAAEEIEDVQEALLARQKILNAH